MKAHVALKLAVSTLAFWWSVAAYAGDALPSFYQDPGINPFRSTVNHNVEEHIDPFTGMLQLHHTDAVIPGNGGFDLVIHRAFNSPSPNYGQTSDTSSYNRTPNVGIGWSFSIGGRILPAGSCWGGSGNQMILETPDGSRQGLIRVNSASNDFRSTSRWKAVCVTGGVQVYSPSGTRYDMLKAITEGIPNSISTGSFYYPTQITDRNGNTATFSYGTQGPTTLLNSVSTSDGRTVQFGYVLNGSVYQLWSMTTQSGTWQFDYAAELYNFSNQPVAFRLTNVYPPSGGSWNYTYNSCATTLAGACSISRFTNPDGGSTSYTYNLVNFNDTTGNTSVVGSKFNAYGSWSFTYSPGSPYDTTTVSTPLGTTTYRHYGYTGISSGNVWRIGLLASKTSGAEQTETYSWQQSQPISIFPTYRGYTVNDPATYAPQLTSRVISRDGTTYSTSYSGFDVITGNPSTKVETGEASRTTSLSYCTDMSKWILNVPGTQTISGGVGQIFRTFDGNCNLMSESRFGVTTNFSYTSAGDLSSRTDANGKLTSYSNHYRGIPQSEFRPEGVTINRTVYSSGNVQSQSDGAGNVHAYQYDSIRRLTRVTPPVGTATSIAWSGLNTRTATRGAYTESLAADGFGNPSRITRNAIATAIRVDAFSNKTFESLPGASYGTTSPRDILGRVQQLRNSDNSLKSFSYAGSSVTVTDELSNPSTIYRYRSFGDPDEKYLSSVSLPGGNNIAIVRDSLGNMKSVTQGTITRTYGYDSKYFLTSIADPETGTTTFTRDNVGNMTSSTVSGRKSTFTYDGLNRIKNIAYPNGESVAITYFDNGRTKTIIRTGGAVASTWTYGYDSNANLTSERLDVGGKSFTVAYTYSLNDALKTITYPATNNVVSYNPDALGRPTSASPFVTSVSHWPSGNVKAMTYANGVNMSFGEDSRQWPSSLSAMKGGTFLNRTYTYDYVGNLNLMNDLVSSSQSMLLSYDARNQLTSASGLWGSASVSYDGVGNITSYGVGSSFRTYTYSSNRLATFAGRSFSYDGYGNVSNDGLHDFQYDDASNLTCVDCGTSPIRYGYDGNNRRVSRVENGKTTYFVHGSDGSLLLEYSLATGTTIEHIYLKGKRIASKTIP